MQYIELVEKFEATAEDVKNHLRALELQMFNEDKERLQCEHGAIVIARVELDCDDVRFVSFPTHKPLLPVDLSSTHIILTEDGSVLYRLKTSMKIIEPFFVGSVDEIPCQPAGKSFFWHRFSLKFTPARKHSHVFDTVETLVSEAFNFLTEEDRNFMWAVCNLMEESIRNVPARDIVACIDKPFEPKRSIRYQIEEMYEAKHR